MKCDSEFQIVMQVCHLCEGETFRGGWMEKVEAVALFPQILCTLI